MYCCLCRQMIIFNCLTQKAFCLIPVWLTLLIPHDWISFCFIWINHLRQGFYEWYCQCFRHLILHLYQNLSWHPRYLTIPKFIFYSFLELALDFWKFFCLDELFKLKAHLNFEFSPRLSAQHFFSLRYSKTIMFSTFHKGSCCHFYHEDNSLIFPMVGLHSHTFIVAKWYHSQSSCTSQ